jgi:hypothetical protein
MRRKTITAREIIRGAKAKKTRELHFAGYDFMSGPKGTIIHREFVDRGSPGDYGADPLGNGLFKMFPSGDIVDLEERNRRLRR